MRKVVIDTHSDGVIVTSPSSISKLGSAPLIDSTLSSMPPFVEKDYRIQFLAFFIKQSYSSLLDISCGDQARLLKWARWLGLDIIGTNIEDEALEKNKNDGILSVKVDLDDENLIIPFKDNSFDVVTCTEVIEHLKYPRKVVDEMYRISKHLCFITTPLNDSYDTPDHIQFWSIDSFIDEILSGYDNYTLRTIVTKPMDLLLNWRVFVVSIHK